VKIKKIGIVGCGNIGAELAKVIREECKDRAEIFAVYDIDEEKAKKLGEYVPLNKLVKRCDIVVEAASPKAVKELLPMVEARRKKIFVMSTGGLIGEKIFKGVYFPSGAIAGLDGVSAVSRAKINKITLTTTKPEKSLGNTKYENDTIVFSGTVPEAVKAFPANINVCATLALISKRQDLVMVQIIASPSIKRNVHEVEVEGDFGKIFCRMENVPSPDNPKTSYLAILSAIDALKKILYG